MFEKLGMHRIINQQSESLLKVKSSKLKTLEFRNQMTSNKGAASILILHYFLQDYTLIV